MDHIFDLRKATDIDLLASYLPNIDGREFLVNPKLFKYLLESIAKWLSYPEWLIYQYGVICLSQGNNQFSFGLSELIELADYLDNLSTFTGFEKFLTKFKNPRQFHDTVFEAKVARLFTIKTNFQNLEFDPPCYIKGKIKKPDLKVTINDRPIIVECKSLNLFSHRAGKKFSRDVKSFSLAIDKVQWPETLRLEIEIILSANEDMNKVAKRVINRALNGECEFEESTIKAFVVPRNSDFKTQSTGYQNNRLILNTSEATGPFNPKFTQLRVVNNSMRNKIIKSVANTISEALKQLPEEQECIIALNGVSDEIVSLCLDRSTVKDSYSRIKFFINFHDNSTKLFFKKSEFNFVKELFPSDCIETQNL